MTTAKLTKDFAIPNFEDIEISTRTFTAITNLDVNHDELFANLPITPYIEVPKKRGRKKKGETIDPNKDLKPGSIISLILRQQIRGVDLRKKKGKWFRNSLTIIMMLDKLINIKIYGNGTFQMTGCKNEEHALECVRYLDKTWHKYKEGVELKAVFAPAMTNIDFPLGFIVDREKLDIYMNRNTDHYCFVEPPFGYTGVNIKIPLDKDINTLKVVKLNGEKRSEGTYDEYIELLPLKDQKSKRSKKRHNTFLVFHSGKVIMSGINRDFMREAYYQFMDIISKCINEIEERLDTD